MSESVRTKPSHALSFSLLNYDDRMWKISETDSDLKSYIYSKTDDAALNLTFIATEYWVEGSTDPNYGSAQISEAEISLNGEHKNNYVYFKSGLINQTDEGSEHNIVIKNVPNRAPISFSRLLYNYIPSMAELPRNGLIRVYYNEMEYEDTKWNRENQRISTNQEGASASCNFNGIKAYIYAYKCPDGGLFAVYIDDEFQDIINLQSTNSNDYLVYESNDLPFGQHKIEVRSVSSGTITLIFFLYRPHLIFNALSYNTRPAGWTGIEAEGINPAYNQSKSAGSVIVRCTRFWLVGKKGSEYGSFKITLSVNNDIKFEETVTIPSQTESTSSVLLYESRVFEYNANNKITITPLESKFVAISDILFSQQPKDAVVIYGKDLKMSGSFFYDSRFDTYGINTSVSDFQFSYCGDKFYSYGLQCWSCVREFTVMDNDTDLITNGNANKPPGSPTQLFPLGNFEPGFGNHDITFTPNEGNEENKPNLYIHYIFYLTYSNPPSNPYLNLTKEDIITSFNAISTSDDYIELPVIGSKVVFEYWGSNFTLEGYLGPASGNVNIYHNNTLLHSDVPLYREENKFSFFYSSKGFEDGLHNITIVNCNGNPVYISKLCYKPLPPTNVFTLSTGFTNSELFTQSLSFSISELFSKSFSFADSKSFSKSLTFSNSKSFSKSLTFSNSDSFTISESFSLSLSFSASTDFHHPTGSNTKSKTQTNIIIGVCVAILALLVIVLIIVFLYLRNRKHSEVEKQDQTVYEAEATTIDIFSPPTQQEEDNDSIINSINNDLFGEMILSNE